MKLDKDIVKNSDAVFDNVLATLLATPRPYGSTGDLTSRTWLKAELARINRDIGEWYDIEADAKGNIFALHISRPTVLYTCHTDTAHQGEGRHIAAERDGMYILAEGSTSSCLGADDAVGVAICAGMMAYGVEADFVFYVGEEVGAIGSGWSVDYDAGRYAQYHAAISLDRRGTTSVITHQGARTASDAFARSLAHLLNASGYVRGYKPDPTGIFTDSKMLTHLIPECTNLSVGYYNEHTQREKLDVEHARGLMHALLVLDTDQLVIERSVEDDDYYLYGYSAYDDYLGYDLLPEAYGFEDDDTDPLDQSHRHDQPVMVYIDENGVLTEYDPYPGRALPGDDHDW